LKRGFDLSARKDFQNKLAEKFKDKRDFLRTIKKLKAALKAEVKF